MRICLVKRCRISRRTTALARLAGSMVKDNFPPRKIKSSARYIKERFRIFHWVGGGVFVTCFGDTSLGPPAAAFCHCSYLVPLLCIWSPRCPACLQRSVLDCNLASIPFWSSPRERGGLFIMVNVRARTVQTLVNVLFQPNGCTLVTSPYFVWLLFSLFRSRK